MYYCHYHIAAHALEAAEETFKRGYTTAADHDRPKEELEV